jgi:hypothetical protein
MIIAIDFDGTIAVDNYPSIGTVMPYARQVINRLADDGHYIIIWTSRNGARLLEAINWLLEQGIRFHRINAHEPTSMIRYGDDSRKVFADVYIDDRNIGGFQGWRWVAQLLFEQDKNND